MTSGSLSVTHDGGGGNLDLVVQHVDERLLLWQINLDRKATVFVCVNLGIVDPIASGLLFSQRELICKLTFGCPFVLSLSLKEQKWDKDKKYQYDNYIVSTKKL